MPARRRRVGALRLVLSELQKAAKEGGDDELAVLRRERKRRLGGRDGLPRRRAARISPRGEEAEGELIGAYLPAELSDDELDGDRRAGGARQRRAVGEGHGAGDEAGDGRRRRPRRRQARLRARAGVAARMRTPGRALQRSRRRAGGQPGRGAACAAGAPRLQGLPARQPAHVRRRGERDAAPASASCASSPS